MSAIDTYLQAIQTAVYGEEVRDAIHDAIEQCYEDVNQQVSMIEAAGAAQIAAVQAKGAETIETIPDNYDALGENVKNERDNVVSSYLTNALPYFIKTTNVWTDSATGTHYMIPVAPGDKVVVRAKREAQTQYAILRSFDTPVLNETPDYSTVSGFTERMTVASDTSSPEFTVPSDGLYLCANGTVTSSGTLYDYTPASILVNGVEVFSGIRSYIKNLLDRQSIFQSLSLREVKRFDWYVDAVGRKYQPQSIAVTDDYIVIGMNSVNTTQFPDVFDKYNAFLALDKTTLEPANLETNPVIIDFANGGHVITASHAGNMSYVASSNELWVRTMTSVVSTNRYAIVLDAGTLALKTFMQMPYSGAFGYDNQNGKWCFLQDDPGNSKKYYAREFESTRTTQVGVVSVWKQGITQGCEFYDSAIFIPNSPPSGSQGNSLMMVDGSTGVLLADWWFEDVNEFEDISFIDDQIMLLNSTSSYGSLLVGAYKPYNRHRDNILNYLYLYNSKVDFLN